MFVKNPHEVKSQIMDMPGAKGVTMQLMIGREDSAPNFAMRLFTVETSGHTPLHSHNYEHEVMIVSGEGEVTGGVDGQEVKPIKAGDVIFMPANDVHQFRNTGPSELKFICLVPVSFDCGKGECAITPGS